MTSKKTDEPVVQNKIHLLMEETGCDQGQAELAMTSAGYDLEKAIRTIGTLLRNIVVVKGKFLVAGKNLYGRLILIADTKRQSMLRIRAVVSYNPAIYESVLDENWYDFEKELYAFRLWEGTLQQATQELERLLAERLEKEGPENFYEILRQGRTESLRERFGRLLNGYFEGGGVDLSLITEELNLEQYRRFKPKDEETVRPAGVEPAEEDPVSGESLRLHVDLQQDADGIPAEQVRVGDSVYVLLTDNRDIAQYLSKLLGGRSDKGLKPLVTPVEAARQEAGVIHFQIRLSGGILGLAQVNAPSLLRVQKRATLSWWRRWAPFWD